MNKEMKKLLKKLDILAEKVDVLTKVAAISIQGEKLFEGKMQKERIEILAKRKLPRDIIALIVGTTPESVSVTLSQMKPQKKKAKPKSQSEQEESVEQ